MSNKKPEPDGMTIIAKSITRILLGIMTVFGLYIALYGHLTPGGGFAGGVIVAGSFILLTLTFGKKVSLSVFSDFMSSVLDNVGALMFVIIAFLGFLSGTFFMNFLAKSEPFGLLSSGSILLSNIAIMIKVMAGLFAVFVGLSIFGRIVAKGEKEE